MNQAASVTGPATHFSQRKTPSIMCKHLPQCPTAECSDREAARTVAHYPEQGWSLLCNGVLLFEDTGELLPDGQSIAARRRELLGAAAHRKT